jgi:hypothetical protein
VKHPARHHTLALLALLLSPIALTSQAQAQAQEDDRYACDVSIFCLNSSFRITSDGLISYSVSLGLTIIGAGITTTFVLMQQGADANEEEVRRYIIQEQDALRAAHAVGGGSPVDDLAAMFWIPSHKRGLLGEVMRTDRAALDWLLDEGCEGATRCDLMAQRYMARLLAGMNARPEAHRALLPTPDLKDPHGR